MLLHVIPERWWRGEFSGRLFVRGEEKGVFVDGVRPSVRRERYTKMAGLYVMPSASVVLARKVRRRLRREGHRGWCRRMADANEKADGQQMLEQVAINVYIYILY